MLIGCQTVVLHPAARHEQRGESVAESSQPEDNTARWGTARWGTVLAAKAVGTQDKEWFGHEGRWKRKERHCYSHEGSGNTRKGTAIAAKAAETQEEGKTNAAS